MKTSLVKKAIGALGALALSIGGLFTVGATANAADNTPAQTELTGSITWHVKDSWHNYVNMFSGTTEAIAPATKTGEAKTTTFTFPLTSGLSASQRLSEYPFEGGAHWAVPDHFIDVTMNNIVLVNAGREWSLKGDMTTSAGEKLTGITMATLAVAGRPDITATKHVYTFNATATEDFNKAIPRYTDLAPLTVTLNFPAKDDSTTQPGTGNTDQPGTGGTDHSDPSNPDIGNQGGDNSGTDHPSVGGTDQPGTDQPATNPGTDTPGTGQPGTDDSNGNVTPENPSNEPKEIVGDLTWNILKAFNDHIAKFKGSIEATDGAGMADDQGTFVFPLNPGQTHASRTDETLGFAGKGIYHYALMGNPLFDMEISNVALEVKGGTAQIVANVRWTSKNSGMVQDQDFGRIVIADLSAPSYTMQDEWHTLTYTKATLNAQTVPAFSGYYPAGTELGAPTFRFKYAPATEQPTPTPGVTGGNNGQNGNADQNGATTTPAKETYTPESTEKAPACVVDENLLGVKSGSFTWGFREQFTTYIRGSIAHGGWTLGKGAQWNGSAFTFAAAGGNYNKGTKVGTLRFAGSVHFTGHNGVLDMTISNPSVAIKGSSATIYATVSSKTMEGKMVNYGRVPLANVSGVSVSVQGGTLKVNAGSTALNAAAVPALAGYLEAGAPMSGFSVNVAVAPTTVCDKDGEGLANTGAGVGATAAVALAFLALGVAGIASRRKVNNK